MQQSILYTEKYDFIQGSQKGRSIIPLFHLFMQNRPPEKRLPPVPFLVYLFLREAFARFFSWFLWLTKLTLFTPDSILIDIEVINTKITSTTTTMFRQHKPEYTMQTY